MNFTIITHVIHGKDQSGYFGYGPYVREMNLWLKYTEEVTVVAPLQSAGTDAIDLSYEHERIQFKPIRSFSFTSLTSTVTAFVRLPHILWVLFCAMRKADHIHLRCPGNVGLLGCLVQILFPSKRKTAKYAGNWDPKAKQPLSYRLQKWILSNTFLTRNMQVLVYGEWEGSTRNIKPFFTATYKEGDKTDVSVREILRQAQDDRGILRQAQDDREVLRQAQDIIRFLFVGTLSEGKRPLYAVRLAEALQRKGYAVHLDLYGEGAERVRLETYIQEKKLQDFVVLKGNQTSDTIKKAYQDSHFLLLPSKSEGWPKVVAEAMFWGCVPAATGVSCVPYMLDYGGRGIVLGMDFDTDVEQIEACVNDAEGYRRKAKKALHWSREYTLDSFEEEVKLLLGGDCLLE